MSLFLAMISKLFGLISKRDNYITTIYFPMTTTCIQNHAYINVSYYSMQSFNHTLIQQTYFTKCIIILHYTVSIPI